MDAGQCMPDGIELLFVTASEDHCVVSLMELLRQLEAHTASSPGYQHRSLFQFHWEHLALLINLDGADELLLLPTHAWPSINSIADGSGD
jgi:hypothetical protein